jgi:hypothetical protein
MNDKTSGQRQSIKDENDCLACRTIGVATCLGLSSFFAYHAFEVELPLTLSPFQRTIHKPVYLTIAVAFAGMGFYRAQME